MLTPTHRDDEQDEESDSSSLEMDMSAGSMLVDVPNTNSLNNSLRAAYKKTSNPPSPGGPVVAPVKKRSFIFLVEPRIWQLIEHCSFVIEKVIRNQEAISNRSPRRD
jgi:hypothetical protein